MDILLRWGKKQKQMLGGGGRIRCAIDVHSRVRVGLVKMYHPPPSICELPSQPASHCAENPILFFIFYHDCIVADTSIARPVG